MSVASLRPSLPGFCFRSSSGGDELAMNYGRTNRTDMDDTSPPYVTTPELVSGSDDSFDRLVEITRGRHATVALTGAGISTESGIPDYRGPHGIWTTGKLPRLDDFVTNAVTRAAYWTSWRERYPAARLIRPNEGHRALVALERAGVLLAVVTQNIDGLHIEAGQDPARVLELHGTRRLLRCLANGHEWDADLIYQAIRDTDVEPVCEMCGSPLRSSTVLFGEPLPTATLRRATEVARSCDLLLVVGSSLVVNPAARLPRLASRSGAATAILNREPTLLDDTFDVVVHAEAGPTLSRLIDALGLARRPDTTPGQAR